MWKLLGALFILVSCYGLGVKQSGILRTYLNDLIEMKRIMSLLSGEIRYTLTPLPEAFINIGGKCRQPFSSLFKELGENLNRLEGQSFQMRWEEMLLLLVKSTKFKKEDIEALKTLGTSLGYLDKKMQMGAIESFVEQSDEKIKVIRAEVEQKTKLYHTLGIMGGLLMVIVLI